MMQHIAFSAVPPAGECAALLDMLRYSWTVAFERRNSRRLMLGRFLEILPRLNIGNYARSFSLSSRIDQNKIGAELRDGVLSLVLPKVEESKPRTIQVK